MNTGDRPTPRRIAAATIIGTLGSGLMVATVVRLLQVAREILPWWWPYPLIIGSILFIIALLLLIPYSWWRKINYLRWRLPRWFYETYIWILYGPKYIIEPMISSNILKTESGYDGHYTATIHIHIENKAKPIKINLNSAKVCLQQRVGWEQDICDLQLETHGGIPERSLKPREKDDYEVEVSTILRGANLEYFPNPNKEDCRHGYQGIYVSLPKRVNKELHKGIYYKPPHTEGFRLI